MKTYIEYRSLGEHKANFTNSSIRQPKETEVWYQQEAEACEEMNSNTKLTLGLLAGAGAGLLAGLLLAPQKGTDTRRKLSDTAAKLGSQMSKGLSSSRMKAGDWINRANQKNRTNQRTQTATGATNPTTTGADLAVD